MAVEGESIHMDYEMENSADEAIKEHESQQISLTLESILFTFVANVLLYWSLFIVFSWMVFYQLATGLCFFPRYWRVLIRVYFLIMITQFIIFKITYFYLFSSLIGYLLKSTFEGLAYQPCLNTVV